jgi:phage terminase large subunit-like protein
MKPLENALDLLFALQLESGERWGAVAAPFQLRDALAILEPLPPTQHHYLTRPRGASKTTDVAALGIVQLLLLLRPGARAYAIAADLEQGKLLLDSIRGFATRTPALDGAFQFTADRVFAPSSGSTLQVLPCDDAGLWGLRPDLVIVDELGQWPDTERARARFEAVATSLPKIPGRMLVITTPSAPGHWSHGLLEHARADPLWQTHETRGLVPWIDPLLLEGEERRLSESQFARLHLGEWVEPDDRLALIEDIRACIDPTLDGRPRGHNHYVVSVDLSVVNDRTAIVVAHGEVEISRDGGEQIRVIVDLIKTWTPTRATPVPFDEVERTIVALASSYRATVVIDAWNAAGIAQRLRDRFRVHEFRPTASSNGELAANLMLLFRRRQISIPNDETLLAELANVRLREGATAGVVRLDHARGKHDDQAYAVGMAALAIVSKPPNRGPRIRLLT